MSPTPLHRSGLRSRTAAAIGILLAAALSGCAYLGLGSGREAEEGAGPLVLAEDVTTTPEEEREAAETLEAASEALAEGNAPRAWDLARRVEQEYPGTASSGPALLVRARAGLEIGRAEESLALLDRYAGLMSEEDPRRADLTLFGAERLLVDGLEAQAARAILELPGEVPSSTADWALVRLRAAVDSLHPDTLWTLLEEEPADSAMAAAVLVANARMAWILAQPERSAELAQEALRTGARGPDAVEARELLERIGRGDVPGPSRTRMRTSGPFELGAPATIGVLLPSSGSPALSRYARMLEEGIRVALEGEQAPGGLELTLRDDGGRPDQAVRAFRALEDTAVVGTVGPLLEEEVLAVADARTGPTPIVSPTARHLGGKEHVYSLSGPDPGAAHALAEYAMESGLGQVVVIHPATEEHTWEAEAFRERMHELGGSVLRVLTYPPGTTTFEEVLRTARFLEPRALVLPVPSEDIVALAPQVSFFGLDTLGIRVLGTSEWTAEEVLLEVSTRHTDGVVVATPRSPEGESEGLRRFEDAYEQHFRRSLRDRVPALGYDAAMLLLQGLRSGARDAAELATALEWVEDFPGATGVLSIEDGRVLRRHYLACIQDRRLRPVEPGDRTTYFRPERRGDPAEGEPERVPLGPPRLYCPGVPVPEAPSAGGGSIGADTTGSRP